MADKEPTTKQDKQEAKKSKRLAYNAYHRAYYSKNKERILPQREAIRAANPEKFREAVREWRRKNPELAAEYGRRGVRKFKGIPEPTSQMPKLCEICCKPPKKRLNVDHCHETGKFRGWLCTGCNTALGKFGDSVAGLMRAVAYLKKNR